LGHHEGNDDVVKQAEFHFYATSPSLFGGDVYDFFSACGVDVLELLYLMWILKMSLFQKYLSAH
jgi:hypothetical protein